MSENKNDIRLLITDGQRQAVINAAVSFTVEERQDIEAIHISDVVHALILQKLREQEQAVLPPGEYCLNLTCAIVDLTPEDIPAESVPPPLPISLTKDDIEFLDEEDEEDPIELTQPKTAEDEV